MAEAKASSPTLDVNPTPASNEPGISGKEHQIEESTSTEILPPPSRKAPQDEVPDDVQANRDRLNLVRQQNRERREALDKYFAANPDKKRSYKPRMVARKSYSGSFYPYATTARPLTVTQPSGKVEKSHSYNLRSKAKSAAKADSSTCPESK